MSIRCFVPFACAVVLPVALMPADAGAQTTSIGVLGGVNLANMQVTDTLGSDVISPNQDIRVGVAGGLFIACDFSRHVGLEVDALFSQKGTTSTDPFYEGAKMELRVSYLEFPALVRATWPASDAVTVRFIGGPALAVKLDHAFAFDGKDLSDDENAEADEFFNTFDLGVAVGAALQFRRFIVDARYTHGLKKAYEERDAGDEGSDVVVKNRSFTVMVGYAFR